MSERKARRELSDKLNHYKPSRYSKALNLYQRHTLKKIDPIIRALSLPSPLSPRFPIYKILKAVARLLMLNEFELMLTAILLKESKWDIDCSVIR